MQGEGSAAIKASKALLALAQCGGLALGEEREAPVEHRGDESQEKDEEGRTRDRGRECRLGEARVAMRVTGGRMRGEDRRLHRRIVHSRYGEPHRDGCDKLLDKARVLKGEPKGDRRGSHGDQDRNRDPERVVIDMRAHPHRRHAGVVHGDDAEADEAAAEEEDFRCRLFATDGVKPDAGDENGDDERQGRQRDVVAHVHPRHAEGEHRHEVHRPDAPAHRDRGCREPRVAGPARRGSDAAGEIESRIGSRGGDQNGERDERRIVCSGDGHAQPVRKRPMGETYSLSIRAESACHISNVRSERVRLCAVKARGV